MATMKIKSRKVESWGKWECVMNRIVPTESGYTVAAKRNRVYSVRVQKWHTPILGIGGFPNNTGLRLSIMRTDGKPIRGAHWRDIQRIKSDMGYGDYWACEWYPPDAEVLDPANLYYLTLWPLGSSIPDHCGLNGIAGEYDAG